MKHKITGGCHCGAIRYETEVENFEAAHCHCQMCQKANGNIFATMFVVPKSSVSWSTKPPKYFESSALAKRGFCSDCGTPLSFEYHDYDFMDLTVGGLDHPEQMKLARHDGVESRLEGFHTPDDLPDRRTDAGKNYYARWKKIYGEDSEPGPLFHP